MTEQEFQFSLSQFVSHIKESDLYKDYIVKKEKAETFAHLQELAKKRDEQLELIASDPANSAFHKDEVQRIKAEINSDPLMDDYLKSEKKVRKLIFYIQDKLNGVILK